MTHYARVLTTVLAYVAAIGWFFVIPQYIVFPSPLFYLFSPALALAGVVVVGTGPSSKAVLSAVRYLLVLMGLVLFFFSVALFRLGSGLV